MPDEPLRNLHDPACATCGHLFSEHAPSGDCLHGRCECGGFANDSDEDFWDYLLSR